MMRLNSLVNGLIAATAVLFVGARFIQGAHEQGPVLRAAATFVAGPSASDSASVTSASNSSTKAALAALGDVVRPLSHARARDGDQQLLRVQDGAS